MKGKILGVILIIVFSGLVFFAGMDSRTVGSPIDAYQVYLDGEKIGLIKSKNELLNLIDTEQTIIKEKYNVDKVYPPDGLDIKKMYTYNDDIVDAESIYNTIKDKEPFTIEGYRATITYTEEKVMNDGEVIPPGEPVHLYMLDKNIFEKALYNTAKSFIGAEELVNYNEGTQKEITDTGEIITSIYFRETMTIKKDLVSTEEHIFFSESELSKYLLYGTLEEQDKYSIQSGEDLESIADNHNLNIDELLIANPQFTSANVLLTPGEEINVGLIQPLVSVVYNKTVVSDVDVQYKTEVIKDKTKYVTYEEVQTEGQNGVKRLTQSVTYENGEIQNLDIVQQRILKEAVNEVIVKGTRALPVYNPDPNTGEIPESGDNGVPPVYANLSGNNDWSWPTISPFIITSRYKWRWGRQHQGVDISGCGKGSPIFAVRGGTVYYVNYNASKSEGLSVYIDHGIVNGQHVVTQYMHLSKILVTQGQQVSREQKIGLMGSTGASTGTHLHLGVSIGYPYRGGTFQDPCKSIFKC